MGKKKKVTAQKAYIVKVRCEGHPALQVSPYGLNLMTSVTYLAASTNGKVLDPSHSPPEGLLEIRCPFSIDGELITGLAPSAIVSRYGNKFYLSERDDGRLALDRQSHCYEQVQGELVVCGREWCDFVVWTQQSLFVERIQFEPDYWKSLFSLLENFFQLSVT